LGKSVFLKTGFFNNLTGTKAKRRKK